MGIDAIPLALSILIVLLIHLAIQRRRSYAPPENHGLRPLPGEAPHVE